MAFDWPEDKWVDNIHQDGYARSLGYKGPVIVGWSTARIAVKMLIDFFGESFFGRGKILWKTIYPVYTGNLITTRAKLVDKVTEDEKIRVVV